MTSQHNFFANSPTFEQDYIEKITTNLKMKNYLSKYKENAVVVAHDSRINNCYYMIVSVTLFLKRVKVWNKLT